MPTWQNIANLKGPTGATGPSGTSFTWRGAWSSSTAYAANDVVSRSGSSYICVSANTNHDPATDDGTRWAIMAQIGNTGATGSTGAAGANAPNPYGTLQAAFTPPAVGSNIQVTLDVTGWANAGEWVTVGGGGGSYYIVSVDSTTKITIENTGAQGNGTASVASGSTVTPAGIRGSLMQPSVSGSGSLPTIDGVLVRTGDYCIDTSGNLYQVQ